MDSRERSRAARFVQPVHAERYTRFHAATRLVLSMYTGVPPERIVYSEPAEPGEKPVLASGAPHFSLSHTGGHAVLAVSPEPVGVDIEEIRSITDLGSLAARVFSAGELSKFAAVPLSRRQTAFFSCWTRKEAILKEMGTGLSLDPSLLTVGWGTPVAEDARGVWQLQRVRGLPPRVIGWVASGRRFKVTQMSVVP